MSGESEATLASQTEQLQDCWEAPPRPSLRSLYGSPLGHHLAVPAMYGFFAGVLVVAPVAMALYLVEELGLGLAWMIAIVPVLAGLMVWPGAVALRNRERVLPSYLPVLLLYGLGVVGADSLLDADLVVLIPAFVATVLGTGLVGLLIGSLWLIVARLSLPLVHFCKMRTRDAWEKRARGFAGSGRQASLKGAFLLGADLRRVDLGGGNPPALGANLRDAVLACANLEGADLSYACLLNANLEGA